MFVRNRDGLCTQCKLATMSVCGTVFSVCMCAARIFMCMLLGMYLLCVCVCKSVYVDLPGYKQESHCRCRSVLSRKSAENTLVGA